MKNACHVPFLFAVAAMLPAQSPHGVSHAWPHAWPHQWIVPGRSLLPAGDRAVRITAAAAHVRVLDRAATTTLELELHNPADRDQQAVLLLPVPDGAAVSQFTFLGTAPEPTARILPRDDARRLYDEITAKLRDPALLEFAGLNCLRSSVFPVPRGGVQKIRLAYDHVLDVDGERIDYVLPRSEMLADNVPWSITVELQARAPIGVCYSPSHEVHVTRRGDSAMTLRVAEPSRRNPGAFRLCYTTTSDPTKPTAAMFAYPDPATGGGWFLLLVNAPPPADAAPMRREVTLVLDRSGSMAGKKLEQAKAAALQVLEGLADGEGFQVIDYGSDVRRAFEQPVRKDAKTLAAAREHIAAIRPLGGTNIHDALVEALRAPAMPGTLPLVLFLTDGVPTVGPTGEADLNRLVAGHNPHARRVFCFGVGNDVNAPLLDRVAETTRAVTTYVLPDEDVEVKVARTFARMHHPVLAEPTLRVTNDASARSCIEDVVPRVLPDLFIGDQIVLLGRYRGRAAHDGLEWSLAGRGAAGKREFHFELSLQGASTQYAFVPRLWASRQIGFLVDELRQRAAEPGSSIHDPRWRELRDEILRLSTRFGVLGEYTAFLATEGSRLDDWSALSAACADVLSGRAIATRSGAAAVNQGCNLWNQKQQVVANPYNAYLDHELKAVEVTSVQQVCDRAFFRRGDRWIDGNSVASRRVDIDERVELGSARWRELVRELENDRRSGVLSLPGEILLDVKGKNVLVTVPRTAAAAAGEYANPQETVR